MAVRRAGVLACVLLAAACDDIPRLEPPPIAEVALAADGSMRLDGRPIDGQKLDRELARRAADARSEKLGRTRLQVHITTAPGTDYARVLDLQERCQEMGISQVEVAR